MSSGLNVTGGEIVDMCNVVDDPVDSGVEQAQGKMPGDLIAVSSLICLLGVAIYSGDGNGFWGLLCFIGGIGIFFKISFCKSLAMMFTAIYVALLPCCALFFTMFEGAKLLMRLGVVPLVGEPEKASSFLQFLAALGFIGFLWALFFWMHGVLKRPDVEALFRKGNRYDPPAN